MQSNNHNVVLKFLHRSELQEGGENGEGGESCFLVSIENNLTLALNPL